MTTTIYDLVGGESCIPYYKFENGPLHWEIPFLIKTVAPLFVEISELLECGTVIPIRRVAHIEGLFVKTGAFRMYPIIRGLFYDKRSARRREIDAAFLCDRAGVFIFADQGLSLLEGEPLHEI